MSDAIPSRPFDLIIAGGRILDPASGRDEVSDIAVTNGKVVAIAPGLVAHAAPPKQEYPPEVGTQIIDARGLIVTPGLVDLHTHVYTGVCPLTVPADEIAMQSGATTLVSAGDAGAHTIEGLRRLVANMSRTRVLAFLHISTIGLTGWPVGEATDLDYLDVEAAADAVEQNSDLVVGIKVRQSMPLIVGTHGIEPLRRARSVASRFEIPVMVHIGDAPVPLRDILAELGPGDIVTHCYTGSAHGMVVDGRLIPEVLDARERGVLFDVGHGFGSFDYPTVEACLKADFFPDCISTDIHSLSVNGPARDLPTTMSKLLSLGMSLEAVVAATTSAPSAAIKRSATLGSLRVGGVADIAVLVEHRGGVEFRDAFGNVRHGDRWIEARHTIRAGLPWLAPFPHPGRFPGAPAW